MRPILALLLAMAMPSFAQDGLRFWCQDQTVPGCSLRIGMEREKIWNERTKALESDRAPLGNLQVALYRCDPKGAPFKGVLRLNSSHASPEDPPSLFRSGILPYGHMGNSGLPLVKAFSDPAGRRKEQRRYEEEWVWPKRIALPEKDRILVFECPADLEKGMEIPSQAIGTYVIEIHRGGECAYLPWRVTPLALRAELRPERIVLYGLHASDGSPVRQGVIRVTLRSRDGRNGDKATEGQELLELTKGTAAVAIQPGQTLVEAELLAEGESLPVTTELPGRGPGYPPAQGAPSSPPRRAFVYTDRPVYKPGDELFLKILLDAPDFDPARDLEPVPSFAEEMLSSHQDGSWFRLNPAHEIQVPARGL